VTAIVLRGDAAHLPLPDGSVDLICTSVPYWGLRSYTDNGEHYEGQIGSEETPQEWLEALWKCTREWTRVLKSAGSIFVNCGDKYAAGHGGRSTEGDGDNIRVRRTRPAAEHWAGASSHPSKSTAVIVPGFRPKTLMMLPQRYAIGCMDRLGLILRAEIIWDKANPLPESVQDRVRRAHEQVFHFTKQPRYFAAMDEVREPHNPSTHARGKNGAMSRDGQSLPTWGLDGTQSLRGTEKRYTEPSPLGKMPGSVWEIPSQPLLVPAHLDVDHFAAFPMELPRRCILGWSPSGICLECGEGRRPVAAVTNVEDRKGRKQRIVDFALDAAHGPDGRGGERWRQTVRITGYACACPDASAPTRPAVVVDPFAGTWTSLLVAAALGRIGVGVDRSMDYCRLGRWRTSDPGERARALGVPKPPPVPEGQRSLFDEEAS